MGLTLHSILAGVALAASVRHAGGGTTLAGLGAFVAIPAHAELKINHYPQQQLAPVQAPIVQDDVFSGEVDQTIPH